MGFCIRSPIDIEMEGEITRQPGEFDSPGKFDSDMEFILPFYFTLGFGYKPNHRE
jgi:hypothetical protein